MNDELMYSAVGAAFGAGYVIVALAVLIIELIGMWKIFEKAGKPGWASIIPFYNFYCLCEIAIGNGWLFLLMFVPCANFVIMVICYVKLAVAFGKSPIFGIGMLFFPFIFTLILGFGSAQYLGVEGGIND
ncbi:MAG: DUF5684 domain-containing protein [Ruminococcus sp.]|nr:DUF5684 domain-containing protein [Ruminococcus sp.]MCM1156155.1 DUF5684 domain-containing protein [Roseburia sp.]